MNDEIEHLLASAFTTYRINRELHAVPPHRVYEVEVDGERAICKHSTDPTGSAGLEGRILAFVSEHTTVPVPEIITAGDGYFIARWHPDAPPPGSAIEPTKTWAYGAGVGLATLHDETAKVIDRYGHFTIRDGQLTIIGDRSWQAAALAYIARHRPVLDRFGHADMADIAYETLEEAPDLFEGVGGPVCCHGWVSPEHVTVTEEGQPACMVDFEHAMAAPPAFDYWRAVVATFGPGEPTPEQCAFRRGYESIRPLDDRFDDRKPLFDILNLVYFFESLYVQEQHEPDEIERRAKHMRKLLTAKLDTLC